MHKRHLVVIFACKAELDNDDGVCRELRVSGRVEL